MQNGKINYGLQRKCDSPEHIPIMTRKMVKNIVELYRRKIFLIEGWIKQTGMKQYGIKHYQRRTGKRHSDK